MTKRPTLQGLIGGRSRAADQLQEYETLVAQARQGKPPSNKTCIRASLLFYRKVLLRGEPVFRTLNRVEQTVVDALAHRYIEDVAYVAENVSPEEAKRLLEYAADVHFLRSTTSDSPCITMTFGGEALIHQYAVG